jgi:hypothetical protein
MVTTIAAWIAFLCIALFLLQAMGDFIGGIARFLSRLTGRGDTYVFQQFKDEWPVKARRGDPLAPTEDENAGWIQGEAHRREINREK